LQKEQELASEGVSDAGVGNAKGEENKTIVDETGEQNKSKKAGRPRKK
jgi:hypothetical protein